MGGAGAGVGVGIIGISMKATDYNLTQCGDKVQPHTLIQPTSASEGKAEGGGSPTAARKHVLGLGIFISAAKS